ncbi:MAG: cysteine--tRNA ligase [Acidimicrobiales bacterium]
MLHLYDTALRRVEPLRQREAGIVTMYVCGPTVYDLPHIGHGRSALAFDVLRRYLEFTGVEVRHVSNITDIDDRIIAKANAEGRSCAEVSARFEAAWWEAVDALGVLRPTVAPRATEYVEQMVELIGLLVDDGRAYETSDGVYLAVETVDGYGLLAHQDLDSLRSGSRVEVAEEKRSPLDFVLWKKAKPGEPTWPSPWGPGRPGWHTECVVMSLDLLGDGFDLHGGGVDLVFPHHENERAQAVGLGRAFARHWAHNGHVMTGREKMSKSLGNFVTLAELLSSTDQRAYRLLVLRAHYRSQFEVTTEALADAAEALARLDALARRFELDPLLADTNLAQASATGALEAVLDRFVGHMDDDLDTPSALSLVFDTVRSAHAAADAGGDDGARAHAVTAAVMCGALGVRLRAGGGELDMEVAELVRARDEARAQRDWDAADQIRTCLEADGWVVEDTPQGTKAHRRSP